MARLKQTAIAVPVELETAAHWWCRRCGRWEVCDDRDRCAECAWMSPAARLRVWLLRWARR